MDQGIKVYHNPRCSKSRQVLHLLEQSSMEFEVIEYLKETPSLEELSNIIKKLGIPPMALVRKGEEIFKTKFKDKRLSNSEWIEAMVTYPKLIERPIVVKGDKAVIGRPIEAVKDLLQ